MCTSVSIATSTIKMSLKQTVAPSADLLTFSATAMAATNAPSADSTLIDRLIVAAVTWCERRTKRQFRNATWRVSLDDFPRCGDRIIYLPLPPVQTVTITYVDTNGATQTLAADQYQLDTDSEPARLAEAYDATWPATRCVLNAVKITQVCGYGASPVSLPADLAQAVLMLVGHWYENREAVLTGTVSKEVEFSVGALLAPYRTNVLGRIEMEA